METKQPSNTIKLRPETWQKFKSIASDRRWTMTETADALADHFIARPMTPQQTPKRQENAHA